jgi:hypothetical protein
MYRLDGTGLYRLSGTKAGPPERADRLGESKAFPWSRAFRRRTTMRPHTKLFEGSEPVGWLERDV